MATVPFLTFRLHEMELAIRLAAIREIVDCETITPVPGAPRAIRGIFNLRGKILPAIDLAAKLGYGETLVGRRTCVIVLDAAYDGVSGRIGVLADSAIEVLEIDPEELHLPPAFGSQIRVDHLAGIAHCDERLVFVLNVNRVLSLDELVAAEEIRDGASSAEARHANAE